MNKISYRRHRFPAEIIQRAVWLCSGFRSVTAMWRICSLNVVSMFLTRRYGAGL